MGDTVIGAYDKLGEIGIESEIVGRRRQKWNLTDELARMGEDEKCVLVGDVDVRVGYYHPVRPPNTRIGRRLKRDEMKIGDNALEVELVIFENGVDIYSDDI